VAWSDLKDFAYGAAAWLLGLDWYSLAGPIATIVAALAAVRVTAYFSRQQAETAKRQADIAEGLARTAERQAETAIDELRFKLFDERLGVHEDIRQFLWTLVFEATDFDVVAVRPHLLVMDEARFYFSPATSDWLQTVRKDCETFLAANSAVMGEGGHPFPGPIPSPLKRSPGFLN
jgi:hypothetical protein